MTFHSASSADVAAGPLQRRDRLICALGVLLCAMGGGIFYVQPAFSDAFARALAASPRDVGFVDALEVASLTVASILMAITPARFGLRFMIVSVVTVAIGNLLSGWVTNIHLLAAVRCVVGLIGEGPLIAYSFVVLGKMTRPERGFGFAQAAVATCGMIALQPALQFRWAGHGASLLLFAALAVPALILLAIVLKLPDGGTAPRGTAGTVPAWAGLRALDRRTIGVLAGQAIWAAAPGLLWPFTAQLAARSSLGEPVLMAALSVSTMFGLSGLVIPIVFRNWAHHRSLIAIASVGLGAAASLIYVAGSFLALTGSCAAFTLFWNMGQIYQPALLVAVDRSGRGVSFISFVQLSGMAIGTALGGFAIQRWGTQAVPIACIAAVVLSMPFFLPWRTTRFRNEKLPQPAGA